MAASGSNTAEVRMYLASCAASAKVCRESLRVYQYRVGANVQLDEQLITFGPSESTGHRDAGFELPVAAGIGWGHAGEFCPCS